jgi:hypothetical protein
MSDIITAIDNSMNIDIWSFAKIPYLIFLVVYLVFAAIVVRQINLMTNTINGQLSPAIKLIGNIHLIIAALIFFLALILL